MSGERPTSSSSSATRSPVVAVDLLDPQRLGDRGADGQAGIERRLRVLEDDLHLAPQRAHLLAAEAGDVDALELDRTGGRLDQAQHATPDGRLAAAALADQAEGLAGLPMSNDTSDTACTGSLTARSPSVVWTSNVLVSSVT